MYYPYLSASLLLIFGVLADVGSASKYTLKRDDLSIVSFATGAQEVPLVVSDTKAKLKLNFDNGFTKLNFRLVVSDGEQITKAHLHCGAAGSNGGVIVTLFNVPAVDIDGLAATGSLEAGDLSGIACNGGNIGNLATLYDAILARQVYLNVHSVANGYGEVRGQIFP